MSGIYNKAKEIKVPSRLKWQLSGIGLWPLILIFVLLLVRITAIADAYEVMSNGRPYKKAMSRSEIVAELKNCSGTHFDPELVEIFLSILEGDK